MTQPRKAKHLRNTPQPAPTPVLTPAAPRMDADPAAQPLPLLIMVALVALIFCVQSIVLAFTPWTYLLDEVKVLLFFIMGPLLMLIALGAVVLRLAPLPPRAVTWGLLAYGLVLGVSTMASAYPWIGKFYILFNWASVGFFLTAFAVSSYRRGSYHLIRYLTILLLVEVIIGLFMYDMTSSPAHHSGIALLKDLLYPPGSSAEGSPFYQLVETLVRADDQLQSTILNRDFFAGFCCLLTPFATLLALHPGPSRHPRVWRAIGIVTALLGLLTIFLCQSKGEWITTAFAVVFFVAMLFKIGYLKRRDLARGHLMIWLIGFAILGGTLALMKSPTLFFQLKSTSASFESREIIWSGAWQIFKADAHNMIIGGGPGTFRIYFSAHRRPDYYLHGINNVTTLSHNYFLDILSETGIVGMIAFGIFLGALGGLALRHMLKKDHDLELRLWLLAAITAMIMIYGSNMTSPNARWVIGATPLWTVMGLLAGLVHQAQKGSFNPLQPEAAESAPPAWMPDALAAFLPQLRWNLPLGLLLLGCFFQGYGFYTGTHYFNSQQQYALGYSYLEAASGMLSKGSGDPNTIQAYLEQSARYFEQSIALDRTNTSAYYKIGSAYTTLAQVQNNIAHTLSSRGDLNTARSLSEQGDSNLFKAKNAYEELMRYDPDYAEIHYNMGIIYQLYAELIRRAIANKITGEEFTPERAAYYEQKALEHLEKMGKTSSKADVAKLAGQNYQQMNHFDKARDVFKAAAHRPSADEDMIILYFNAAQQANDFASACDALELLWLRRPSKNEWLDQLVQLARANHFTEELQRVAKRLEEINPIHPKLFEVKIELAQEAGKPEEVLANQERYMKVDGQDLELYQLGAAAAEKLGRADQAKAIYQAMLKIDKDAKTPLGQEARRKLNPAAAAAAAAPATSATQPVAAPTSATQPAAPAPAATATSQSKTR